MQGHRHRLACWRGVEFLAVDERALVVHHELLFGLLVTFLGSDVFFLAALGDDFVLKAALGGGDAFALAVFREEFLAGFEVGGGGFLFAALEHLAERLHGGLEFGFFELGLAALDGGHESLEEGLRIEVIGTHAELAELLGESAAGAETERVGGIRLDHGGIELRLGGNFDGRRGGFRFGRVRRLAVWADVVAIRPRASAPGMNLRIICLVEEREN